MRIAYCCADPGVPVFGVKGCSRHVQEMVRALRALGAEVTLFATRRGGEPPADLADLPLVDLPRLGADDAGREGAALDANPAIAARIRAHGPFDLIYERYSLWCHAAMEEALRQGATGILEVNAPLIEEQIRYRSLRDIDAASRVARRAFDAASALVAVSAGVGDYLAGFPEADAKIHVIANGVDPHRFVDVVPSLPATPGVLTLGFVGSLKPWHGLDRLLTAFDALHRRRPASQLLIVGDGPELDSCLRLAGELRLGDAVILTGAVDPSQVPGLLASMEIAVAPYPPCEGFYFSPLKVYEYMAAGRAIVASRIGQIDGLIQDGEHGLLYRPGDDEGLVEALWRLAESPRLRERLGAAARARVTADHTWGAVARRVLALDGAATPREPRRAI